MLRKIKALSPFAFIALIYTFFVTMDSERANHENFCSCSEENLVQEPVFEVPHNLSLSDLNITGNAERNSLFFNRVPKVGSQSINRLLEALRGQNRFSFVRDKANNVEQITMSREKEQALAVRISKYPENSVYSKHVAMVDFRKFNMPMPIYINLVRHPVDRLISWHYYIRAAWYIVERNRLFPGNPLPNSNWVRKSFDECVQDPNDAECTYLSGSKDGFGDHRRQSIFFCGMGPECIPFNTKAAIAKAKENVEKYFAVVGVLEELNKTLTVLEHFVPKFFKGSVDVYWKTADNVNRNELKPSVSDLTKRLVSANLTEEIDFYQWCKHRLNTMYHVLIRDGVVR